MKRVTAEEQKEINLELLLFFDKTCRKHGIHYSITGGTLLGAVRHGGFIPWDDDVDVFLPRPEFEKLRDVFDDGERFVWTDRRKNASFPYNFGRLIDTETIITDAKGMPSEGMGLFLDVCVVDGLPEGEKKRNAHMKRMIFLHRARSSFIYNRELPEYRSGNIIKRLSKSVFTKVTSVDFWLDRAETEARRYPFDNSEYVANGLSQYGKKEIMHRSAFDSYIEMEFEGHKVMACCGWEEYLTNIYGDYMKLPPPEKRVGDHIVSVYYRDQRPEV